jgi:hypothetical protein
VPFKDVIILRQRRSRLISEAIRLGELLHHCGGPNTSESAIWSTGILNHLWQTWCCFWRYYWLAYVQGGKDAGGSLIRGFCPGISEPEAIYQMLILAGKRKVGSQGTIFSSHQEATWGDIQKIQDIANRLLSVYPGLSRVLSAASLHGQNISHLHVTRNSQVHPGRSAQANVLILAPHYLVRSSHFTATELVYSREIRSGKLALSSWIDSMIAFAMMV